MSYASSQLRRNVFYPGKRIKAFGHNDWQKKMTMELHIDLVYQSVSRKLTLMKLLSKYVNQNSLKQYYNSSVLPVFEFWCVGWCNTTNANLTRLVKLQKRVAMMILKADFMAPSEQLFKELNWLPFPKRVQYHTCLTVYKSITGQAPEFISSLLTFISDHNEKQTRSTTLDLLHIPRSYSANFWLGIFSSRSKIME